MAPSVTIHTLDEGDADACAAFGQSIGWHAEAAQWRSFLALAEGLGARSSDGRLVGTVLANRFGSTLAMVAMMGVHPDHRRAGVGRHLMERLHEHTRGAVTYLYASPQGQRLYASLGYVEAGSSTRWAGPGFTLTGAPPADLRPMVSGDLDAVVALDAEAQGAPRERLLDDLLSSRESAWVVERSGRIEGFGLAFRNRGRQLGPIVTRAAEDAARLAERLGDGAADVLIDLEPGDTSLEGWVATRRLQPVEPSPRMTLGGRPLPGRRAWVRTLAGRPYG